MSWMLFWKICFVLVLGAFAVLAVLVSWLGARDVRELFRRLRDESNDESGE